jgi:hypothetical protein
MSETKRFYSRLHECVSLTGTKGTTGEDMEEGNGERRKGRMQTTRGGRE